MKNKELTPMEGVRDSGEKIREGGLEILKGVREVTEGACETIAGLFQTGSNLTSAGVSTMSSKMGEKGDEEVAQLHDQRKSNLKQAGKGGKQVWRGVKTLGKGAYHGVKGTLKTAGGALLGGYHIMDAGDKKMEKRKGQKTQQKKAA